VQLRRPFSAATMLTMHLALAFAYGSAQSTNATLGGTVTDSSKALIPGVTITATNTQTGIVNTAVTNESGTYQFASLQPGVYKVSAELPGFQTQNYNDVTMGVAQQLRLNFTLQIGTVATAVEVTVSADTLLATSSSSVGTVLPEYKVRDLPLAYRNVLDLVSTTAGAGGPNGSNFAGTRTSQVNTTRDGISVQDGRYDNGVYAVTYVSPDLVDEVRVIVAPADAETGRGSGQVQLATRSGTNQFKGSVFWANHNSALDSNTWFANFRGEKPDYLNRNQFGGRLGGPVIKNKTFFFFLYEGQRVVQRGYVTGPVLTAQARQGVFRYFPGAQNGNAFSTTPTVDLDGNPVRPANATGDLRSFSVFGLDPLRPSIDSTGWIQKTIARMPLPNDFTTCGTGGNAPTGNTCDGLNVAGYRWVRRTIGNETASATGTDVNRNQINGRLDHNFNSANKASFTFSREHVWDDTDSPLWPNGYDSEVIRFPRVYTGSFVSTLSPNIANEFRFGKRQGSYILNAEFDHTNTGKELLALLPKGIGGIPYVPQTQLYRGNFINYGLGSRGQRNSLWTYADTLSWTHGKHAFKGGTEVRLGANLSMQAANFYPVVTFGAGSNAVTGIDSSIPGLVANNQTLARQLVTDLSASVSTAVEAFFLNDSKNLVFEAGPEQKGTTWDTRAKLRTLHQNEWSAFFKDDWKPRPNLTLNLGIRYEYYGVPWDEKGLGGHLIGGGTAGVFGISGTSFADMYQPGRLAGKLTAVEFVGKNSPQPDKQLYKDDWNNFAPAVGLSWNLPWFGKDKTVLRAGYGWSYQGGGRGLSLDGIVGGVPGVTWATTATNFLNASQLVFPLSRGTPLQPVGLYERTQNVSTFEDNTVSPYIQNWNLELQRELVKNLTFELRYIGSKGTKLFGGIPVNEVNIFENGILDAFNITRAGGDAPLFDQMLRGLVINAGQSPVGTNGVTGSAALRQNTIFKTFLANGSVGQFASTLNTSTTVTGFAGGLIKNGGLPDNFVVVNPQFNNVTLNGNPGNSTYHSLQLQVTKRLSHGFTNQTSFVWSRALGENDSDGTVNYLNGRDRSLNKSLLGYHRTYDLRSNGTFELPFGSGRIFLTNAPAWVSRLVERWQLGGVFNLTSGAPLNIAVGSATVGTAAWNQYPDGPPTIVGDFPKSLGKITKLPNGIITYFDGLQQIPDPTRGNVTASQTLRDSFSNYAIADSSGKLLLVNPAPGSIGTLGYRWIEGPRTVGFDLNLLKRVRIAETKEFEVRVDAINVLNHPRFASPNLNINNTGFGRITAMNADGAGNRTFVINARVSF
jgi:hypothetical protein